MYSSRRYKNRTYLSGAANYPVSCKSVQGHERKFAEIQVYFSPWSRVCTKAMYTLKGTQGYGEPKNVIFQSVQKSHLPGWASKLPLLMEVSIRTRTEIFGNPGRAFAMVLFLHQSNVFFKRKLGVWRAQIRISLVGAKIVLSCASLQTTACNVSKYGSEN